MNITRRNFIQAIGVVSFNIATGMPSLSNIPLPAHTIYGVNMEGGTQGEAHVKAAYLGIGPVGLDVGKGMSRFLGIDLKKFPVAYHDHLLAKLSESRTIREIESYLRGKDIVAVVGSIDDQGLNYARDLALDKAQLIWTIVVCPPGSEYKAITLTPKPNEVMRVLRHSRYPLDHPDVFTRMAHDIWLYHKTPPQWDVVARAFSDLGI